MIDDEGVEITDAEDAISDDLEEMDLDNPEDMADLDLGEEL